MSNTKSKLTQLKEMTTVVADTGDFDAIAQYSPEDATTNPSLLLKAAQMPAYRGLVDSIVSTTMNGRQSSNEQLADCMDRLAVGFGEKILEQIPGRVSTEVDARLSFDTNASIAKARHLINLYEPADDPGVQSVTRIYNYYKQTGYNTVVMGASFRNTEEITELAGCDRLTISPQLLQALDDDYGTLERRLDPADTGSTIHYSLGGESGFRFELNQDAMATEKMAEGIRGFVADQMKLETWLKDLD